MKLHEYQARDLLAAHGVAIPRGGVAVTVEEARALATELGGRTVVKAQVHAGGRGKGRVVAASEAAAMYDKLMSDAANNAGSVKGDRVGGVRLCDTVEEAVAAAEAMLGKTLVSIQTGAGGVPVERVLVSEQTDVDREFYLSIIIDGALGTPLIIASREGGQEIEVVAATNPDAIVRMPIAPSVGIEPFVGRRLAERFGLSGDQPAQLATLVEGLYATFIATDASLVEINPLVITDDGKVLALDAKLNIDDNALYRHKDLEALRDLAQEDQLEVMAQDLGVANFIKLDGNIGCIVNGAGLAMATMDQIKVSGGEPANFLDIGTVNDPQRVVNALKVIIEDKDVSAVLVNIFGGMARVDVIAQGLIDAHSQLDVKVPVVARLVGTNLAEGERLMEESGINFIRATDFADAAEKAVAAAGS